MVERKQDCVEPDPKAKGEGRVDVYSWRAAASDRDWEEEAVVEVRRGGC